jgi:hypothetical protein
VVAPTKGGSTQGASTQGGLHSRGAHSREPLFNGAPLKGAPLKGAHIQCVEALLSGESLVGVCLCAGPFICGGPSFCGGPGQLPLSRMPCIDLIFRNLIFPENLSISAHSFFGFHGKFLRLCYRNEVCNSSNATSVLCSSHWRMEKGGHGLPKVSPGPAIPDTSMPCRQAIPETALWPS